MFLLLNNIWNFQEKNVMKNIINTQLVLLYVKIYIYHILHTILFVYCSKVKICFESLSYWNKIIFLLSTKMLLKTKNCLVPDILTWVIYMYYSFFQHFFFSKRINLFLYSVFFGIVYGMKTSSYYLTADLGGIFLYKHVIFPDISTFLAVKRLIKLC